MFLSVLAPVLLQYGCGESCRKEFSRKEINLSIPASDVRVLRVELNYAYISLEVQGELTSEIRADISFGALAESLDEAEQVAERGVATLAGGADSMLTVDVLPGQHGGDWLREPLASVRVHAPQETTIEVYRRSQRGGLPPPSSTSVAIRNMHGGATISMVDGGWVRCEGTGGAIAIANRAVREPFSELEGEGWWVQSVHANLDVKEH